MKLRVNARLVSQYQHGKNPHLFFFRNLVKSEIVPRNQHAGSFRTSMFGLVFLEETLQ